MAPDYKIAGEQKKKYRHLNSSEPETIHVFWFLMFAVTRAVSNGWAKKSPRGVATVEACNFSTLIIPIYLSPALDSKHLTRNATRSFNHQAIPSLFVVVHFAAIFSFPL